MNGETKTCPDCAETVKAAARKCRYCGFRFDSEADKSPVIKAAGVTAHDAALKTEEISQKTAQQDQAGPNLKTVASQRDGPVVMGCLVAIAAIVGLFLVAGPNLEDQFKFNYDECVTQAVSADDVIDCQELLDGAESDTVVLSDTAIEATKIALKAEPKIKDFTYQPDNAVQWSIGVLTDGSPRIGYANYICELIDENGAMTPDTKVRIADIEKIARGISAREADLGTINCSDRSVF